MLTTAQVRFRWGSGGEGGRRGKEEESCHVDLEYCVTLLPASSNISDSGKFRWINVKKYIIFMPQWFWFSVGRYIHSYDENYLLDKILDTMSSVLWILFFFFVAGQSDPPLTPCHTSALSRSQHNIVQILFSHNQIFSGMMNYADPTVSGITWPPIYWQSTDAIKSHK